MEFSDSVPPLAERHEAFRRWVCDVRDSAQATSEGARKLSVAGAEAEYEIAPLRDGRWAVRMCLQYQCGNGFGQGSPWDAMETREACVEAFLLAAQRHFSAELNERDSVVNAAQRRARLEMLALLDGGLFGFIEPDPEVE